MRGFTEQIWRGATKTALEEEGVETVYYKVKFDGGERGGVRETGGGRSARSEETVDARAELGAGPSRRGCWESAGEGGWHLGGGGMW